MNVPNLLHKSAEQPMRGIALICLAVLLFASHDAMSKYLSGFYPIVMVVWARYVVHTLLMLVVFVPRSGFSAVVRTKRPGLQLLRALCLIGTSLLFTTGLRYIPLAEATSVNFLAPLLVTALSVPLLGERVPVGGSHHRFYRCADRHPAGRSAVYSGNPAAALFRIVFRFLSVADPHAQRHRQPDHQQLPHRHFQ